ncbi:MAG: beta-galactosidase [Endomicrobiales bacterium]|nr:beta-galactosidase [Endomicrobiales bacterium]
MSSSVNLKKGYFEVNGKKQFILSGEVQYFRTEKKNWKKLLNGLREANCNTLSTYVPWNWHEYEKGKYDFTGKTHPSRDLAGFLKLVKEYGLNVLIKPGPHIHAEFLNGGVPQWVFSEYSQVLSLDKNGNPTADYAFYPPITYLHPDYMQLTKKWFEKFMDVVRPFDNIVMWQVDNEISYSLTYFTYCRGQAFTGDYNPFLINDGPYQRFLEEKYKKIEVLNERYNEKNSCFSQVVPPRNEPANQNEHYKVYDWCEFREKLVGMYAHALMEMLYDLGAKGPFSIDDPLLGYDTAWRDVYNEIKDPRWETIVGYTYYPGSVEEEGMGHHISRIGFTRATGSPLISNHEMQSGDMYFLPHWKQSPSDYDLLWKTAIGCGNNMINFYWFCDGFNFLGYEYFLPELNFLSPLDKNGNKRFQFNILKNIGKFLKENSRIVETNPVYDLAVGYYQPHIRDIKFNNLQGINSFELGKGGMKGSLIDLLGVCNVHFTMLNLEEELSDYNSIPQKKLMFIGSEYLDKNIQSNLIDFADKGGHLILLNNIPKKDEEFNDCRLIWDVLKLKEIKNMPKGKGVFEVNKLRYKNLDFVVCDDVNTFEFADKGFSVDITPANDDRICGFTRNVGKGKISVVGFIPKVFMDISRDFIRKYLNKKSEDGIHIFERKHKNYSVFTICNLREERRKVKVGSKVISAPPRKAIFVVKENNKYKVWDK